MYEPGLCRKYPTTKWAPEREIYLIWVLGRVGPPVPILPFSQNDERGEKEEAGDGDVPAFAEEEEDDNIMWRKCLLK